ncbi:MAG: hypothetical protein ACTTHG_06420 [Treponemataceae bacterium]
MTNKELIDRSPIRFFENATNGGLKAGQVGAITSKKGLGKTSVLVQLGMDYLLQEKQVVHVSFDQQLDSAMTWYEDIFAELTKKKNIPNIDDVKASLLQKRIILNFNQDIISGEQIVDTLKALTSGGINVECLIIDGMDFNRVNEDAIKAFKDYAKKANIVIWFSINTDEIQVNKMFTPAIAEIMDAVIYLEQKPDAIEMSVLKIDGGKSSGSNLKLDSKTLLLSEK